MPLPKIGEERTVPLWFFGNQEVLVRFRWTGEAWENMDTVTFKEGSITINIDRSEPNYTITTYEYGEEEDDETDTSRGD
jgi:hypothetical protein